MAETGVREIQLSGKQLVFLFMASVVLVVVVFLLGVSVGRGARNPLGSVPPDAAVGVTEGVMAAPPNTPVGTDALTYKDLKTADGPAKPAATTSSGVAATPAVAAPPPVAPPPTAHTPDPAPTTPKPAATPAPVAAAVAKPAAPVPTAAKPATAVIGWFVQVESLKSKDSADALVLKLKAKGYDVFIVDEPKPWLRVRVGPYPQRSGADAAVAQLKKDGFSSPFVGR